MYSQAPPKISSIYKDDIAVANGDGSDSEHCNLNAESELWDSSAQTEVDGQPYDADLALPFAEYKPRNNRKWIRILGYGFPSLLFLVWMMGLISPKHGDPRWRYVIPSELNVHHCIEYDKWAPIKADHPNLRQHGVETSFSLPLSSDTLFFTSRGQNWNGGVRMVSSSDQPKGFVKVHIQSRYNKQLVTNPFKACLMERRIDENGVGLFGPFLNDGQPLPPQEETASTFQITFTFPKGNEPWPLQRIRRLESDSPNTKHEIGDLSNILFDYFSLNGSNSWVHVELVAAIEGSIETSNGAITGTFNTTNKLSVATSMAAIDVRANLESKGSSIPQFTARTSNGPLSANMYLTSDSPSSKGGIFDINIENTNAALDLRFSGSPVDSTLNLAASTTNERAIVYLHPAYEGNFALQTSAGSDVILHQDKDVKDPSGIPDRHRKIEYKNNHREKGTLTGLVFWDLWGQPRRDDFGKINITTTDAPLHLNL